MAQALLISHREIVQDIFGLNLKAYVDTNVTIKQSLTEGLEVLKISPNFDLIVTHHQIGSENVSGKVLEFLADEGLEIPVIILGAEGPEQPNVAYVDDLYDIKTVVKTAAMFLEITPKLMAEKPMAEYYPIPVSNIKSMKDAPCEVFIRQTLPGNNFVYKSKIKPQSSCVEQVKELVQDGVRTVYVLSADRLKFVNQATTQVLAVLNDENATQEQVIGALEGGHDIFAKKLSESDEITEEMKNLSQSCVTQMEKVLKTQPQLSALIKTLVGNKTNYAYKHSMIAAYVANHMIDNINWGSKGQSEKMSFVFFFHDIFLTPILQGYSNIRSEEELLFSDQISDKHKDVILNHAQLASKLVQTFPNMPMGADTIILQHHGSKAGNEFAVEYPSHLAPLSKVALIAEKTTELILAHLASGNEGMFNVANALKELAAVFPGDGYKKLLPSLASLKF